MRLPGLRRGASPPARLLFCFCSHLKVRTEGAEGGVSEGKCEERRRKKKAREGKRPRSRFPLKKEEERGGVGVGGGGLFFGELPPLANGLPLFSRPPPCLLSSVFFSPPRPSSRRRCSCSSGLKTRRRGLPVFVFVVWKFAQRKSRGVEKKKART